MQLFKKKPGTAKVAGIVHGNDVVILESGVVYKVESDLTQVTQLKVVPLSTPPVPAPTE